MAKKSSVSSQPARLRSTKSESIANKRWTDRDRAALREIAQRQTAGDDSQVRLDEIPRLTPSQLASMVRLRPTPRKVAVSVRLDPEVIAWLKAKGKGHITRINDILANLMEAERHA